MDAMLLRVRDAFAIFNKHKAERQDGGGAGRCRGPLSTAASGIHLQTQISQSTSSELAGVLNHQKGTHRYTQSPVGQRKEGKKRRRVSGTKRAPTGCGSWSRDGFSTLAQHAGTDRKHLRLSEREAAHLWLSEWSENHTDNLCHYPMCPRQGREPTGMWGIWELKCNDWRATPGWGLLLTTER